MRPAALAARLRDTGAGDEAVDQSPAQAMLVATTTGFSAAEQARDTRALRVEDLRLDRKSTRLNSSHRL